MRQDDHPYFHVTYLLLLLIDSSLQLVKLLMFSLHTRVNEEAHVHVEGSKFSRELSFPE